VTVGGGSGRRRSFAAIGQSALWRSAPPGRSMTDEQGGTFTRTEIIVSLPLTTPSSSSFPEPAQAERQRRARHAEPGEAPRQQSISVRAVDAEAPATHKSRRGRCRSTIPRPGRVRHPTRRGPQEALGTAASGPLRRSRVPGRHPTGGGSTANRPPGWCAPPPPERHRRRLASAGQTVPRPTPRWSSTPRQQGAPAIRTRSTSMCGRPCSQCGFPVAGFRRLERGAWSDECAGRRRSDAFIAGVWKGVRWAQSCVDSRGSDLRVSATRHPPAHEPPSAAGASPRPSAQGAGVARRLKACRRSRMAGTFRSPSGVR